MSYVCQCFSTAAVESIMVPSMSNRRPWKETVSGAAVKAMVVRLSDVPPGMRGRQGRERVWWAIMSHSDLVRQVLSLRGGRSGLDIGGSCSGKVVKKKPQIDLVFCQRQAEQPCFVLWSEARLQTGRTPFFLSREISRSTSKAHWHDTIPVQASPLWSCQIHVPH